MNIKIAFDIHGVLSVGAKKLGPVLFNLKKKGYTICVVSGAPVITQYRELHEKFGYDMSIFDEFYSTVDYLTLKGCTMWRDWKDTWWTNDVNWYPAKAEICRKNNISLLIDNESKYFKHFNKNEKYILFYNEMDVNVLYVNILEILNSYI